MAQSVDRSSARQAGVESHEADEYTTAPRPQEPGLIGQQATRLVWRPAPGLGSLF